MQLVVITIQDIGHHPHTHNGQTAEANEDEDSKAWWGQQHGEMLCKYQHPTPTPSQVWPTYSFHSLKCDPPTPSSLSSVTHLLSPL